MLQKSCFLTLPFFEQISRQKKTHFGQFLVSKWEGGRHEPGPMGREPEGGFHPPWRVITTSRSGTEWNVVNLESRLTRLHRGWNPAADFQAYGSCRPPLRLWDLRFWDLKFESSGFKIWVVRFKIWDFWVLWGLRVENWDAEVLSFEKAKISLHDRCPVPPTECDLCSFWNLILLISALSSVLYLLFCCFRAYRTAVLYLDFAVFRCCFPLVFPRPCRPLSTLSLPCQIWLWEVLRGFR